MPLPRIFLCLSRPLPSLCVCLDSEKLDMLQFKFHYMFSTLAIFQIFLLEITLISSWNALAHFVFKHWTDRNRFTVSIESEKSAKQNGFFVAQFNICHSDEHFNLSLFPSGCFYVCNLLRTWRTFLIAMWKIIKSANTKHVSISFQPL